MPFADLAEFRMHYVERGTGEAAIFLHGFTIDHRMWEPQLDYFGSRFRMICPDARGHGLSGAPATGYGRDQRVEDLRQLADILGLDRFHLIGLSMGGTTAIGFALKYQARLRSLTLVSTGAAGWDVSKKISRLDRLAREHGIEAAKRQWIDWSLRALVGEHQEIAARIRTMMVEHSGAVWMDEMRGKYPRTVDLDHVRNITVPTMIFAGELDRIFVPLAQKLNEKITGSRLSLFKATGHMLNMEQPERFNRELLQFLQPVSDPH